MKLLRILHQLFAVNCALPLMLLNGCTTSLQGTAAAAKGSAARESVSRSPDAFAKPPREERPGLATAWGEERDSHVALMEFRRANGNTPAATGRLFYNDRKGTQAMLVQFGREPASRIGLQRLSGGFGAFGLQNGDGAWLESWHLGGLTHVVGEKGDRYSVVVRNESSGRIEIVVSVDGLDVLDGKSASYRKRGYILDPGETYAIEGFRTSQAAVAAFRFSSVSQSYAALKHEDTRNVGVIGIAAFTERNEEVAKRREADPFPRSWARAPWD